MCTVVVIGLGERNAQADNGRAEMVCNDKWRKNKIKQKLQSHKRTKEIQVQCKKECEKEKIQKQNIEKANDIIIFKQRKMDTIK